MEIFELLTEGKLIGLVEELNIEDDREVKVSEVSCINDLEEN